MRDSVTQDRGTTVTVRVAGDFVGLPERREKQNCYSVQTSLNDSRVLDGNLRVYRLSELSEERVEAGEV